MPEQWHISTEEAEGTLVCTEAYFSQFGADPAPPTFEDLFPEMILGVKLVHKATSKAAARLTPTHPALDRISQFF